MLKYAQIVDYRTKQCNVGIGTNTEFYKTVGMEEMEVEQANNGNWYLQGYAPVQSLDELKTQKLQEIATWTSLAITGGFISNCTGSEVRYDSDVDTQITMQGIALNVNTEQFVREYPQGCPVRGYAENATEKQIFLLQAAQVLQFCADLSKHIGAQKQRGWELQEVVKVAETKEELSQIIW